MKAMLGHDGPPTNYWRENLITGEKLQRCPLKTLIDAPDEFAGEFVEINTVDYPMFRRGHLKVSGGISDQPARWLAYMAELDRVAGIVDKLAAAPEGEDDA